MAPPHLDPVNSRHGPSQRKGVSTLNGCRGCYQTFLTFRTPVVSFSCWHVRPLDHLIITWHTALLFLGERLWLCVFCKSVTLVGYLLLSWGFLLVQRVPSGEHDELNSATYRNENSWSAHLIPYNIKIPLTLEPFTAISRSWPISRYGCNTAWGKKKQPIVFHYSQFLFCFSVFFRFCLEQVGLVLSFDRTLILNDDERLCLPVRCFLLKLNLIPNVGILSFISNWMIYFQTSCWTVVSWWQWQVLEGISRHWQGGQEWTVDGELSPLDAACSFGSILVPSLLHKIAESETMTAFTLVTGKDPPSYTTVVHLFQGIEATYVPPH